MSPSLAPEKNVPWAFKQAVSEAAPRCRCARGLSQDRRRLADTDQRGFAQCEEVEGRVKRSADGADNIGTALLLEMKLLRRRFDGGYRSPSVGTTTTNKSHILSNISA
jgi:hypothetical protein